VIAPRARRIRIVTMPRYYVTIGPEAPDQHPTAGSPTWIIDAAEVDAARYRAEATYRRSNPNVVLLRLRVTPARSCERHA